jgi:hypothetical protein|tara:strand:+ start:607 stop:987 length:381 start_codon:yes stop_codon:yes gene_type:complete
MNWKETYTKIFLKQSDIAVSDANVKQYMSDWWQNIRGKTDGGLRLTEDGFDFLHDNLEIQMYEIPFPRDFKFTTQTYIFLDQFITCPYYLTNRSIWVTDEKKSMELHLFSGDLRKYGLTKAMKRHE